MQMGFTLAVVGLHLTIVVLFPYPQWIGVSVSIILGCATGLIGLEIYERFERIVASADFDQFMASLRADAGEIEQKALESSIGSGVNG